MRRRIAALGCLLALAAGGGGAPPRPAPPCRNARDEPRPPHTRSGPTRLKSYTV